MVCVLMEWQVLNAWARMVFGSRADASSASAEDRMAHAAATTNDSMRQRRPSQETAGEEPVRRPGEQGFVMRARVPMAAARDYTKRPEPKRAVLDKIGEDLEKLQGTRKAYIKKSKELHPYKNPDNPTAVGNWAMTALATS